MYKLNYYDRHHRNANNYIYFLDSLLGDNIITPSAMRKIKNDFNYKNQSSETDFLKLKIMQYQLLRVIYDKFDSLKVLIKTRS